MKAGSLSVIWNGVVLAMVSLLLACTIGWDVLPDAQAQTAPPVDTNDTTYAANDVDQPVQIVTEPKPHYPKLLRDSLISGRVELQYVVDTTGHAEPNSIRVISKTREEFVERANEAILASTFRPARFRDRSVRQLVQQRISFKAHSNSSSPSHFPLSGALAILMASLLGALSRRRPAPNTPAGRLLNYGIVARTFSGIVSLGSIGSGILIAETQLTQGNYFSGLVIPILVWLFALWFIAEFFFIRIIWNDQEIRSEAPWRSPRSIRWEDLRRVAYIKTAHGGGLRLYTTEGKKFWPTLFIRDYRTGFPDFGRDVLRLVPSTAVFRSCERLARSLEVAPDLGLSP